MDALASSIVRKDCQHAQAHVPAPSRNERRTRWVVAITVVTMFAELIVGYATNAMSLIADGWHMATHAGALGLAALAYWFARKEAGSTTYSFGTGKVHGLAGYTSALALGVVGLLMIVESIERLITPEVVVFMQALPVAILGLVVNLASMKLLAPADHGHDHDHDHAHGDHGHGGHGDDGHHDHNMRAAYVHVVADSLTSVLAIGALIAGHFAGWAFMDPLTGIIGGVIIAHWAYGHLLDVVPSRELADKIRAGIESAFDARVVDLHLWEIGPKKQALILSIAAHSPSPVSAYREALAGIADLEHVTIEVHVATERSLEQASR